MVTAYTMATTPSGTTETGEYEMCCSVPGHREAGMVRTLVVEAG